MSAQTEILSKYGLPDEKYQSRHMELWYIQNDFPWTKNIINTATGKGLERVFINRDFKTKLIQAFKALEHGCLYKEIKTWDGCYVQRPVRGKTTTSLHSYGMAVDLNAATEKLSQLKTAWSTEFLNTMKGAGLYWGGDWHSRKDNMHFALYNG